MTAKKTKLKEATLIIPSSLFLVKREANNSLGFTLLEVLVAITILGVSFITIFELFSGSLKLAKSSEDYLTATLLAQKKINELRLKNFELEEEEEAGEFEEDPRYLWSVTTEPYKTKFKRDPEKEDMKKVELKVFWKDGFRQKEFSLVRLFAPMKWGYPGMDIGKAGEKGEGKGEEKVTGPKETETDEAVVDKDEGASPTPHISGQ